MAEGGEPGQAEIDRLTRWIDARGLAGPTILALEMGKPLALIASQLLFLLQPLLSCLSLAGGPFEDSSLTRYAALLEDPASVDRLVSRIERREQAGAAAGASGLSEPDGLQLDSTRLE